MRRPLLALVLLVAAIASAGPAGPAAAAEVARVPIPPGYGTGFNGPWVDGARAVFDATGFVPSEVRLLAAPGATAAPDVLAVLGPPLPFGGTSVSGRGAAGAVVVRRTTRCCGDKYNAPFTTSDRIETGPPAGPRTVLAVCADSPAPIDGGRIALLEGPGCDAVVVRDVRTAQEIARFPVGGGRRPGGIELAGERVAWWHGYGSYVPYPPAPTPVTVGDLTTGATRVAWNGPAITDMALAPDGTIAVIRPPSRQEGGPALVRVGPDGARTETPYTLGDGGQLAGFLDERVVWSRDLPEAQELDAVGPDGTPVALLRAQPRAVAAQGDAHGALLGVDASSGRLAWAARTCDTVVVGLERAEEVPAGGLDLRDTRRCLRPTLLDRAAVVDRRGRLAVTLSCPAACSGRLRLFLEAGTVPAADRRISLARGRHRVRLALPAKARVKLRRYARRGFELPGRIEAQTEIAGGTGNVLGGLSLRMRSR